MIAISKPRPQRRVPRWHAQFLTFLPVITRYARNAFRDRDPESREDEHGADVGEDEVLVRGSAIVLFLVVVDDQEE